MKSKNNIFSSLSLILVIVSSFYFAGMVAYGVYGFGNDFYALYSEPNLKGYGNWGEEIGYRIVTLTIFGKNVGVFLVSFMLAFSTGILFRSFFKFKQNDSIIIFFIIYLLAIHTWPIIMSTSNAMRQGLSMSLAFLSFSYLLNNQKNRSFIIFFIALFIHKTGLIFFYIFFNMLVIDFILKRIFNYKFTSKICVLYGIFLLIITFYILKANMDLNEYSRIIRGDYRVPFFIINLSFIIYYTYRNNLLLNNNLNLFLYIFSFVALAILYAGLNWQYERFNMTMLIPYILVTSLLFKKFFRYIYWSLAFTSLFFLTIFNGMYGALN